MTPKTGVMVDTQVLLHACHYDIAQHAKGQLRKHIETKLRKLRDDMETCAALVVKTNPLYISALTVVEFGNRAEALELEWKDALGRRLVPLPVDASVADAAALLMRTARRESLKDVCPICLNNLKAHPCDGCNRSISAYHRFADAVIAATAQVSKDVGTLYCYDSGILNGLAGLLKGRCAVQKPPKLTKPGSRQLDLVDVQSRPIEPPF